MFFSTIFSSTLCLCEWVSESNLGLLKRNMHKLTIHNDEWYTSISDNRAALENPMWMVYLYQPCYSKVSSLRHYDYGFRLYFLLPTSHKMLNFQWLMNLLFFCKAAIKSKPLSPWQICILHLDFLLKKLKILSYDLVILKSNLQKWVFNFYTTLFLSRWPYTSADHCGMWTTNLENMFV